MEFTLKPNSEITFEELFKDIEKFPADAGYIFEVNILSGDASIKKGSIQGNSSFGSITDSYCEQLKGMNYSLKSFDGCNIDFNIYQYGKKLLS